MTQRGTLASGCKARVGGLSQREDTAVTSASAKAFRNIPSNLCKTSDCALGIQSVPTVLGRVLGESRLLPVTESAVSSKGWRIKSGLVDKP